MDGYFRVPGCSDMFLQLWAFETALDSDQGPKNRRQNLYTKSLRFADSPILSTLLLICSSFSRKLMVIRCLFALGKAQFVAGR